MRRGLEATNCTEEGGDLGEGNLFLLQILPLHASLFTIDILDW